MNIIFGLILVTGLSFGSPVDYEISFAGNFAEPRPNHFHGGDDLKTGGVEGKPVFSVASGYVSSVTIGIGGLGNAVYVHHPEGYTSVYCHLRKFNPWIAAMVRKWQYSNHSYNGEIKFSPTDLPVARGQLIAVSGNTGASEAPHLHFEIHDTRTWNIMDPLDFIGNHVKDTLPPMAHGFMAYPQTGEGLFCGGINQQSFNFTSHNLTRKFTAWGKVGFGIWANDYMEQTYNHYGVRKTELLVDGKLAFRSDVDNIPVYDAMMVNAWGDYEHYLRYNVWYMKSFVQPGITLPIFTTNTNRGFIDFNKEREYHITYVLTDFKGNTSKYTFTVMGKKPGLPRMGEVRKSHPMRTLLWHKPDVYQLPGMQLAIGRNSLADNLELRPNVRLQPGKLSDEYRLMPVSTPLFHYATISLRLNRKVRDTSKLYIVSHFGFDRYMGGKYVNGWVSGKARELGASYEVAYDETPPVITPIGQGSWNANHVIRLGLQDTGSGVVRYEGYVDGHFVLFETVPRSQWVMCKLGDTPVRKTGRLRNLVFTATDNRNNKKIFTTKIKY